MSIAANIVEGRQKKSERDFARFLEYALASTSELEQHLLVARDLRAIKKSDFRATLDQVVDVRKMLHGLITKLSRSKPSAPNGTVRSSAADSGQRSAGSG